MIQSLHSLPFKLRRADVDFSTEIKTSSAILGIPHGSRRLYHTLNVVCADFSQSLSPSPSSAVSFNCVGFTLFSFLIFSSTPFPPSLIWPLKVFVVYLYRLFERRRFFGACCEARGFLSVIYLLDSMCSTQRSARAVEWLIKLRFVDGNFKAW